MLLALVVFFAWHAQNFRLDASADSLLLENDPDLEFSREINNRYGTADSVTVAYSPDGNLFDPAELQVLERLSEDLLAIDRVESVNSILTVPIFGDTPLTGISEDYSDPAGTGNRSCCGARGDHDQSGFPQCAAES